MLLTSLKTFNKRVYKLSQSLTFKNFIHRSLKKLLKVNLAFAQRYIEIKQNELDLIFHTRKSLPYCKDTPWVKKEGNGEFDVTMGINDGAETCKIVGLFLSYSVGEKSNKTT